MNRLPLFDLYTTMRAQRIILSFNGTLSQDVLVGLAEIIKEKISQEGGAYSISKKVFGIFIELAQNILHYSAERVTVNHTEQTVGTGIIVVSEDDRYYAITSGNLVDSDRVTQLQIHCDRINSLDRDQLRMFYRERIKLPRDTGQQGGGIGLIEIAKKAGSRLSYEIIPINDAHSFFILSVNVSKEDMNG